MVDNKQKPKYSIEVVDQGCVTCGHEKRWCVVKPDDSQHHTEYEDEEQAQEIADLMNEAYLEGVNHKGVHPDIGNSHRIIADHNDILSKENKRLLAILKEVDNADNCSAGMGTVYEMGRAMSSVRAALDKAGLR